MKIEDMPKLECPFVREEIIRGIGKKKFSAKFKERGKDDKN